MVDKNKTTGYLVFTLGVLLLLVTFSLAIYTYLNPTFIEGFSDLVEVGNQDFAPFVDFLIYLIPAIFLFAMGSVAGKITKYGIQMIKSPEKKTIEKVKREKKRPTPAQNKRTQPTQETTEKGKSRAKPKPSNQESRQPKTEQTKQKQSTQK
ncbi:MAG: hypothetical protein V5A76_01335 [Candidatus Thermoplasmatota archaeon]